MCHQFIAEFQNLSFHNNDGFQALEMKPEEEEEGSLKWWKSLNAQKNWEGSSTMNCFPLQELCIFGISRRISETSQQIKLLWHKPQYQERQLLPSRAIWDLFHPLRAEWFNIHITRDSPMRWLQPPVFGEMSDIRWLGWWCCLFWRIASVILWQESTRGAVLKISSQQ